MSKNNYRRRRRWPHVLILLIFIIAAALGVYHCLIQEPDLNKTTSYTLKDLSSASNSDTQSTSKRKEDFYTILISGEDDGNGGSDTNILVGFDSAGKTIHCVSIPRDSGMYVRGSVAKINSAFNRGGMELLADSISNGLGIPVDYTIKVNLKGFVKLVDAINGVDFNIPINMNYDDPKQNLHIHFKKGMHHLNGQQALEVVRFRHNNDGSGYGTEDLGRITTQQSFLKAVTKKALTLSNIGKLSKFLRIFHESVDTGLSTNNLAWFSAQTLAIGLDNIHFSTLDGTWVRSRSLYMIDPDKALELVNSSLNPYKEERTTSDLNLPR